MTKFSESIEAGVKAELKRRREKAHAELVKKRKALIAKLWIAVADNKAEEFTGSLAARGLRLRMKARNFAKAQLPKLSPKLRFLAAEIMRGLVEGFRDLKHKNQPDGLQLHIVQAFHAQTLFEAARMQGYKGDDWAKLYTSEAHEEFLLVQLARSVGLDIDRPDGPANFGSLPDTALGLLQHLPRYDRSGEFYEDFGDEDDVEDLAVLPETPVTTGAGEPMSGAELELNLAS